MRSDMAKVLVERPRHGHTDRYRPLRHERKHDLSDDAPKGESIRKPHIALYSGKMLNENLGPLVRFIEKQVGRPWNSVYSEICEHINVTNAVQAHIKQHIKDIIAINTYVDATGQIWDMDRLFPRPMKKGDIYVDRKDNIVKRAKKQRGRRLDPGFKQYVIYLEKVGEPQKTCDDVWVRKRVARLATKRVADEMGFSNVCETFWSPSETEARVHLEKKRRSYEF